MFRWKNNKNFSHYRRNFDRKRDSIINRVLDITRISLDKFNIILVIGY